LHAKTAVADGHWARVGSTNLNVASWFGNYEMDAVVEDDSFAAQMEEMYLEDLANSTEVVLNWKRKVHVQHGRPSRRFVTARGRGSAGRAAAGAIRIGNAIGAAFTGRRVLGSVESKLMTVVGLLLCASAILFAVFPRALVYPVVILLIWAGLALIYKGYQLHRR
jgi:cardiolipin synthase A/B